MDAILQLSSVDAPEKKKEKKNESCQLLVAVRICRKAAP
jgi:hypothetical protein